MSQSKTVITFGTFDVFHIGHVRILQRAKLLGTKLIVGVSSDSLNIRKKNRRPTYSESDRMEIVEALGCVDEVFIEESLELKPEYIRKYGADLLVMGNDWKGKFDDAPCSVMYLDRTPGISTTDILRHLVKK
jgi:glycerol-3-phosphate cytidylyltransferase